MKLLVFAHVPPPNQEQGVTVQGMIEQFGGDRRQAKLRWQPPNRYGIECYHVNAPAFEASENAGELLLVFFYCLQAIWCRFRYGVETFYYIPAPGSKIGLYRNWLVMLLCRPFFKHIIFHWRMPGFARWLELVPGDRARKFTFQPMRDADVSIVLSDSHRREAEKFMPKRVVVIADGVAGLGRPLFTLEQHLANMAEAMRGVESNK